MLASDTENDLTSGIGDTAASEAVEPGVVISADDSTGHRRSWSSVVAFVLLPLLVVALGGAAGWLKWVGGSSRDAQVAAVESVQAAREITTELLSYQPDTVEQTLTAVESRLTGEFRDSYGKLVRDVVIPGAREQNISAIANVAAAASVTASPSRATVLVFVNQTSMVGTAIPTDTASSVRVELDKIGDDWLISSFAPV